jgi:hypothetical protein
MPQAEQVDQQTGQAVFTVEEPDGDTSLICCHFDGKHLPLVGIDYSTINAPIDEGNDTIFIRGDAQPVLRQVLEGMSDIACDLKSLQVIGNSDLEVRVKNARWRSATAKHLRELSASPALLEPAV